MFREVPCGLAGDLIAVGADTALGDPVLDRLELEDLAARFAEIAVGDPADPNERRAAVIAARIEGLTTVEIAAALNISAGRIRHLLAQFRCELAGVQRAQATLEDYPMLSRALHREHARAADRSRREVLERDEEDRRRREHHGELLAEFHAHLGAHILAGRVLAAGYVGEAVIHVRPHLGPRRGIITAAAKSGYLSVVFTEPDTERKLRGRSRLRATLDTDPAALQPADVLSAGAGAGPGEVEEFARLAQRQQPRRPR